MYFNGNIEKLTRENTDYRRVIFTSDYSQLVLMSISVGQDIDLEIHPYIDQFFRIEVGNGEIYLGKQQESRFSISDGSGVVIPHNTYHRIVNTGNVPIQLYSIYSPPNHPKNKVEPVKIPEKKENDKYKKILLSIFMSS